MGGGLHGVMHVEFDIGFGILELRKNSWAFNAKLASKEY